MVKQSSKTVRRWLDHVWHYYLTNPDGTPKVKVHGFGLTARELMFRFPWGSVDSTSWMHTSRYGGVLMDHHFSDGAVRDFRSTFQIVPADASGITAICTPTIETRWTFA